MSAPEGEVPDDGSDLELEGGSTYLGGMVGEVLAYLVGLALAWLIIAMGELAGVLLELSPAKQRYAVIFVASVFVYLYLRHSTRLRLENRRLRALERLVRAAAARTIASRKEARAENDTP